MQKTSRDIAEMERLLWTLFDLTHSFRAKNMVKQLALCRAPSVQEFAGGIKANEDFVREQAADITRKGTFEIKNELFEIYLWYIYLLPLGRLYEYATCFAVYKLQPLFHVYKMMFVKLCEEFGTTKSKGEKYTDVLMATLKRIDAYNKIYCMNNRLERKELNNAVFSFYVEQEKSSVFAQLCLGCCANMNSELVSTIKGELDSLEARRLKAKEENSGEAIDFLKDMKSHVDPKSGNAGPFNNAVGIARKILSSAARAATMYGADLREFIKNDIREFCIREGYKPRSIKEEMKWTNDFYKATEMHKTLWVSQESEEKRIERLSLERALNDIADDDATEADKDLLRALLLTDGVIEDAVEGNQDNIPIDQYRELFLNKTIKEKYHAHHATGGLIRAVYCWDNLRVLMSDKLCLFLAFILEKVAEDPEYELVFKIFMESLVTGCGYKNITLGRLCTNNLPGMPMGIYFSADELAGGNEINKEQIEAKCRSVIREFRSRFVTRKFRSSDIAYTFRAWSTDRARHMTLPEQSLVCGSILPGTRADLYYVVPDKLVESFFKSADSFLDMLIKYLEFCGRTGNGLSKERQSALLPRLLKAKFDLFANIDRRKELWEEGKPHITFTDDEKLNKVMAMVLPEIGKTDKFTIEYFKKIEVAVMFMLILVLLIRAQEAKKIRFRDVSEILRSLVVIGKENRAHFESRILVLIEKVYEFLDSFIRMRKRAERFMPESILKKVKSDEIFIFPDDVSKELKAVIRETTGDTKADADSIRKYAVNYLHNKLVKAGLCSYEDYQSIVGHVFAPGFEQLSPFNYTGFSNYWSIMEHYAKAWEGQIEVLTQQMEALWK